MKKKTFVTAADINFTLHSLARADQRGLRIPNICYVVQYGVRLHRTGLTFCFLRSKDIPVEHQHIDALQKLVGTIVLIDEPTQSVITVYKNPQALSTIRRKTRYYNHS